MLPESGIFHSVLRALEGLMLVGVKQLVAIVQVIIQPEIVIRPAVHKSSKVFGNHPQI